MFRFVWCSLLYLWASYDHFSMQNIKKGFYRVIRFVWCSKITYKLLTIILCIQHIKKGFLSHYCFYKVYRMVWCSQFYLQTSYNHNLNAKYRKKNYFFVQRSNGVFRFGWCSQLHLRTSYDHTLNTKQSLLQS